jgi:hypothetical protein
VAPALVIVPEPVAVAVHAPTLLATESLTFIQWTGPPATSSTWHRHSTPGPWPSAATAVFLFE